MERAPGSALDTTTLAAECRIRNGIQGAHIEHSEQYDGAVVRRLLVAGSNGVVQ